MFLMIKDDAIIILYDSNNRVLLQFRGPNAPNVKDKWSFFGGGIENGENPEEAVRRETFEELNYALQNPRLIFTQDYDFGHKRGKKYCFIEKYDESKELVLGEGDGMRWFSFEELKSLDNLHDACQPFLEKTCDFLLKEQDMIFKKELA